MHGFRRNKVWLWALAALLTGCNLIAGIEQGTARDEDGGSSQVCALDPVCAAGASECQMAPSGTPLKVQTPGDCRKNVCDGKGKVQSVPDLTDVDDGNPCTLDRCIGTTPTHESQKYVECYEGPESTKGKGICVAGVQRCDEAGHPVGECMGQVFPRVETCLYPLDEDCDGQVNEGGEGCVCGDGLVSAEEGEECDDENNDATDNCTTQCKRPACGDGFVYGPDENCDDHNTIDGDLCPKSCHIIVTQVANGRSSVCSVFDGGRIKCWGGNDAGQLGLGDTQARGDGPGEMGNALPDVDLGPGKRAQAIAAGGFHTCALLADGTVKCWGGNDAGQLGLGDTLRRGDGPGEMGNALSAVDLGPGKRAQAIATGYFHTCAQLTDGTVKCWGYNGDGRLGLGDTLYRGTQPGEMGDALPAVDLGPGKKAQAIAAGYFHTCAQLTDGTVKCWGNNDAGQLGLGDTQARGDGLGEMGDALMAVDLGPGKRAQAIATGYVHTCALLDDGSVKCWGYNSGGQLGLGDTQARGDGPGEMGDALMAVDFGSGKSVQVIAAGDLHTCALLTDGTVKCWGANSVGQLGLGDHVDRGIAPGQMGDALPAVELGAGVIPAAIAAGGYTTCVRSTNDIVKCWGDNGFGQLGLGDKLFRGYLPDQMGDALPPVILW